MSKIISKRTSSLDVPLIYHAKHTRSVKKVSLFDVLCRNSINPKRADPSRIEVAFLNRPTLRALSDAIEYLFNQLSLGKMKKESNAAVNELRRYTATWIKNNTNRFNPPSVLATVRFFIQAYMSYILRPGILIFL